MCAELKVLLLAGEAETCMLLGRVLLRLQLTFWRVLVKVHLLLWKGETASAEGWKPLANLAAAVSPGIKQGRTYVHIYTQGIC